MDRWRVDPSIPLVLSEIDPSSTEGAPGNKEATKEATDDLRNKLVGLQERLWAEDNQSLLVVFQAIDAGGKDGAIKKVFSGTNPQGVRVTSFKQPSEEELAHDFLWRVHQHTPARGQIAIFNRSHYEDVLVVRVRDIVPESVWRPRYTFINQFEAGLAAAGTRIVKFLLHISKEEQAERFRKRLENPAKRWKFSVGDLDERKRWDDYQAAFRDAIAETSTEHAPWFVVPADNKWFRDYVVLSVLVDTLEDMDPQFPEPEEGLDNITID